MATVPIKDFEHAYSLVSKICRNHMGTAEEHEEIKTALTLIKASLEDFIRIQQGTSKEPKNVPNF